MKKKVFTLLTLFVWCVTGAWATDYTWNFDAFASEKGATTDGTKFSGDGSPFTVSTSNGVNLYYYDNTTSSSSQARIYLLSSAATVGTDSYTTYLYMGGSGSSSTTNRCYKTGTITGKGTLTVVYRTGTGSCSIFDADDTSSSIASITPSNGTACTSGQIDCGAGKELIIAHSGKCHIYAMKWTEASVDPASPTCTTSQTTVDAFVDKATNLTVTAEHYTGLQWYKATEAGLGDATEVSGAINATYAYTPELADDGKTYYFYCVATNDNATGTKTAQSSTITVNVSIPQIATQTYTANNTTCTWTDIDNAATSTNVGGNGLYFTAGSWNAITVSSGNVILKRGNTLYVQVPTATSTGTITIVSNDNQDDRVLTLNSGATLKMAKSGVTANFVASDVVNINEGYYIKLAHGDGETNFEYKISTSKSSIKVVLNGGFVKTNAGKWASFTPASTAVYNGGSAMTSFTLPAEAKAYIVTDIDVTNVTASVADVMGAGNGYFIKGEGAEATYPVALTTDAASATTGNMIQGCAKATTISNAKIGDADNTKDKYVLGTATIGGNSGKSGLFLVGSSNVTVGAGKAFLLTNTTSGAHVLSLDFDDVTGIQTIKAQKELLEGDFYNLKGQKVAQPTKGLYIVNGRKVVLK